MEPLATAFGVTITVLHDRRERLLAPGPLPDWLEHCRRGWGDFDYAALALLASRRPKETIVVSSHGNLIALALNARDPEVGFEFWKAMPMPAVYPIDLRA